MNETKYWVMLSMIFGPASRRLWQLMCLFETAAEAYEALTCGECEFRLTDSELKNLKSFTSDQADVVMECCSRYGVDLVSYRSSDYPSQLRRIADPPAVLYVKGDLTPLKGRMAVTAVGTRKASDYSIRAAENICGELADNGVTIVSGFALGLDIASHMAAANRGKPTICVGGCGVDVDYPKQNFIYRDKIIESGGAFISEYPLGTQPHPGNFPKRNRILSALGRAAIVFEAAESSGSLITASLAAEQGRSVFCLPPADIFSGAFSGNIRLLKEGAIPLFSAEDVLSCFSPESPIRLDIRREAFEMLRDRSSDKSGVKRKVSPTFADIAAAAENEKKTVSKKKQEKEKTVSSVNLEGTQKRIAELLEQGALHVDLIAQRLEKSADDLISDLMELEINGVVHQLPGSVYELI